MKKILLASMILSTPAIAGGTIAGVENPFTSVAGEFEIETAHNGKYQTRKTEDISVKGTVGSFAGGTVVIGYTKRKETRSKVLTAGKLVGSEKADILSVKFTKIQPSWGFWGAGYAYGKGNNDISLAWSGAAAALGTQKASTTSKLSQIVLFAGTKVTVSGWDVVPMAKYSVKEKKLTAVKLIKDTASAAAGTDFSLPSGKEKYLELRVIAMKKIGAGTLSLGASYFDTKGTNIAYSIDTAAAPAAIVKDNPTNRSSTAFSVGYKLPLNDQLVGDVYYREYKNAETKTKTTYVGLTYKF